MGGGRLGRHIPYDELNDVIHRLTQIDTDYEDDDDNELNRG